MYISYTIYVSLVSFLSCLLVSVLFQEATAARLQRRVRRHNSMDWRVIPWYHFAVVQHSGQVPCPTRKLSIWLSTTTMRWSDSRKPDRLTGDPIALDDEKIKVAFVVLTFKWPTEVDSWVCKNSEFHCWMDREILRLRLDLSLKANKLALAPPGICVCSPRGQWPGRGHQIISHLFSLLGEAIGLWSCRTWTWEKWHGRAIWQYVCNNQYSITKHIKTTSLRNTLAHGKHGTAFAGCIRSGATEGPLRASSSPPRQNCQFFFCAWFVTICLFTAQLYSLRPALVLVLCRLQSLRHMFFYVQCSADVIWRGNRSTHTQHHDASHWDCGTLDSSLW